MDNIVLPVMFAVLIEAVVFYVDVFTVKKLLDWRMIAALIVGILAAVVFQQDLFTEYTAIVPYIGSVFTGIIFARLANMTSDLFGLIRSN